MKTILRKYNKLESNNDHTAAAILLAKHFGTKDEVETLVDIDRKHLRRGHILQEEIDERRNISQKYYKLMHKAKPL